MTDKVILLRTDGNSIIGYGHAMRMIALADMVACDFKICFILKDVSEWLIGEIKKSYSVIQIPFNVPFLNEADYLSTNLPENSEIIVLDGYHYDTRYQKSIHEKTKLKVVSIDDFQPFKYTSEIVINHSGLLSEGQFKKDKNTQLLLGPQYALIRREFNGIARQKRNEISDADTVFVSFGGSESDLYNHILTHLCKKGINHILVVVPDIPRYKNLTDISKSISLYSNLTASEIAALMLKSDFAIVPASTLCYEYCSVKGGLFIMQTADNQKYIHDFIIQSGCGFDYNDFDFYYDSSDFIEKINIQIEKQYEYFNGQNEQNLRKVIFNLVFSDKMELRHATPSDLIRIFEWANDEEARRNSINNKQILLEDHIIWYKKKLSDLNSVLYIFWAENIPLGSIRFDIDQDEAVLSYSIDKYYRRRGLGFLILKKGISALLNEKTKVKVIKGYVHKSNQASNNAFLKIGFKLNLNPVIKFENFNSYSLEIKEI